MPKSYISDIKWFILEPMYKRTKIIATIGPASSKPNVIKKLIKEGVNLFRFNIKHNDYAWHKEKMQLVRSIADSLDTKVGILVDLQGPDIRIGELSKSELVLKKGKNIFIEDEITEVDSIELDKKFIKRLNEGQEIAIDDGKHRLKVVEKISDTKVLTKVIFGSNLTSKKGVFFPDLELNMPSLSERDVEYTKLAKEIKAEYMALSFVREKKDILQLNELLEKQGCKSKIISKIETLQAVKNIDDILDVSDAIMVARGDLGVELYLEAVPAVQKKLIDKCIKLGKPVIVATQMLKSMIDNPMPTRAEVSDVANAAYELADAVMLSEESAMGEYPIKAVHYMARTLKYNELLNLNTRYAKLITKSQTDSIVLAADSLQRYLKESNQNPTAFLVLTESGRTAQLLSATRPELPIYAFTQSNEAAGVLTLSWGVDSQTIKFMRTVDESVKECIKVLLNAQKINKGDSLIVISGQNIGTPGQTDSLRIVTA